MNGKTILGAALAAAAVASATPHPAAAQKAPAPAAAPAWTHGAVCYEVFVRSFYDSNGDGIGDFNGLTSKLDYINDGNANSKTDLGARCIWLMPINPSPSYHGYDVTDYYHVNPQFGTDADFKKFVAAAHARGIKVIIDMVLNHTSNRDPHFQAALHDPKSPYRSWYIFSPKPLGKGPWGENVWHKSPVRDEYYYGVFSAEMPDLNYHTAAVRQEGEKIGAYWMRTMGVDGFRLDAVQYLVEQGNCLKDCAGTHAYLHEYMASLERANPNAYAIGEVWDPLDTLLTYYPNQLTAYFTFDLADSLRTAVRRGTVGGLFGQYVRLQDTLPSYRWSPLLSNHDGTRIMTVLGDSMPSAKQAATLLLTLPGMPYIYYGEEIGMTGDKPDPRLRTPMQWAPRPGMGFTTGKAWESAQPDSMTRTVATEENDPHSLLELYRRLIHLRGSNDALASGRLVPLAASDPHVAAYLRRASRGTVLVVANLSGLPVSGATLSAGAGTLPAGRYTPRDLLGGPNGAILQAGANGAVAGYAPAATLGAHETLVFNLERK
ncbi:MAG: alpha-amylase [Gemmatimonadota bacterium]|nr:alpha-amylase [Gemmatimonadota bacterium]